MSSVPQDAADGTANQSVIATSLPQTNLANFIDGLIMRLGNAASWLWLLLVLVIVVQVAMRYVFGRGSILFEELQWHIYGVGFLLGFAYCLQVNRHVRIDVISEHWSLYTRTWIELLGLLFFLLPFACAVTYEASKLAYRAWELREVSPAPGGLPYRWIIKSFITIGFGLLALAAVARLSRCTALLFGFPKPITSTGSH